MAPSSCGGRAGSLTCCSGLCAQTMELKGTSSLEMPGSAPLQLMAMTAPLSPGTHKTGQTISRDELWRDFFSDPSQWWDNRLEKNNPGSPDFRHKHTKEAHWIDGWSNPPWVKKELAAMIQGQEHCSDVRTLCMAGRLKDALHILHQGGTSDCKTYICLLQECINLQSLAEGKQVHAHIVQSGLKPNLFLFNTLVNMYAKCGSAGDARRVFDEMHGRNLFTWTIMITGYVKHGCGREAFEIYNQMIREGVTPNKVTFICLLKACSSLAVLEKGKEVHADIIKAGIAPDIIVETALVDMYAKCGNIKDARQVFDSMAERNVVSWSAMMAGYAQHGCGMEAFELYEQMKQQGVPPSKVTFICLLKVCASQAALDKGKEVHADIIKAVIAPDVILETALVNMYAKCGNLKNARQVFDKMPKRNLLTWNMLMAGYESHGSGREAFKIYEQMIREGVTPNKVTFICILNVCASLGVLEKGKEVHANITTAGIASDVILETALVDMFAKCGDIEDARQVFDNMPERNVVSWSAMIAGYAQQGCGMEALKIYDQMIQEGEVPNNVTFICALKACASLAALEKGKEVHADIIKAGIVPDIIVETALVDMYAKCGNMKDARQVFDNMAGRDVVSWSVMIAGYGQHGCGREALELFGQIQQEGLKPDSITFTCLLSACNHAGLVDEGCHYFDSMTQDYGLTPMADHFSCMVDLLGRAGRLKEAEDFIKRMPMKPDAAVWESLLGTCRLHGNVEVAEHAAKYLLKWDPQDLDIYAAAGG